MYLLFAQAPARYVYTGGFFVFSSGDTLRTDRITLYVEGKVEGLEKHPAVAKVEKKDNRVIIYLREGKFLSEKDLKKYVRGKVKRIEARRRRRLGEKAPGRMEKHEREKKGEKDLKKVRERKENKSGGRGKDVR